MKVLLVKPISDMHVVLPPIGLGYLASYCQYKVPSLDIAILDCHLKRITPERFRRYIKKWQPDIIGFTALSMEMASALRFARIAKQVLPDVTVVFGGPHVSAVPHQVLLNRAVDYIFRQEAEIGFSHFIKHFHSQERLRAPGLGYRDGDKFLLNEPEVINNLDEIPFPDYEKMGFENYKKMYFMRRFPAAPIMSSRGCPFVCTFCAGHAVSGYKWRSRSVENVIKEIEYLRNRYHIREVNFWDDNFTLDAERTRQFCRVFKHKDWDLIWWCPNGIHMDTLDREILKEMKNSGCYAIAFGIESGSENIRKDMRKRICIKHMEELVGYASAIGIRTQGFFIIGYPTESEDDIRRTIRLSKSLPFLRASFCLFQPIVGSEAYKRLVAADVLNENDTATLTCDYSKTSLPTHYIKDTSRIKMLQRKAVLGFYLRPRVFLRLLIENMSWHQIKELINIVKAYILR